MGVGGVGGGGTVGGWVGGARKTWKPRMHATSLKARFARTCAYRAEDNVTSLMKHVIVSNLQPYEPGKWMFIPFDDVVLFVFGVGGDQGECPATCYCSRARFASKVVMPEPGSVALETRAQRHIELTHRQADTHTRHMGIYG